MRIFMQPARRSDRIVERHYQDTIVRPVVFDEHTDLLDPATLQRLRQLFPGGSAPMWGVMPGKNGANLPEIRKMEPGSWVFFSGDKRLYLGATIAATWRSPQLAERLWGADPDSGTWEYMYALAGPRDFDTPVEELRNLLGWKPTRNIMRFQAVNTAEADILERHFSLQPYTPPPPGGHGSTGRPPVLAGVHSDTASGEDLLSNEADVEMLAQLAAATVTAPPLAIALLGEWGAGKSSFIRQMSSRVDQLAALAAEDPAHSAFTATVRQVHFNAWHYSDEQVWSGLVDHLFRALAPNPEPQAPSLQATAEERRQRADHLARLESDQQQLDTQLARTAQDRPAGFLSFAGSPLEGLRLLYTASRLVLRDLGHGRLALATWLAVLAGTIAAGMWLSSWVPLLLSATSLAAPVLPLLWALRASHTQHTSLTARLRALLEKHQRTLAENVSAARARLAEADAAVRLADFLTERSAPETYQQYRGLLGTVHHDLVQLDERLREARAEWAGAHSQQPPPLERIVLYIDDLDRCPPARVVEVLAAVHLMLALPLFVVVVAVDPRWLLASLEHHYRELFTSHDNAPGWADTQDTATPLDYLDKIFQIPFAVPQTTQEKAARLIRALLATAETPGLADPAQPAEPGSLPAAQEPEAPAPLIAAAPAPEAEPASDLTQGPIPSPVHAPVQLQLEETEIAFMSQMGGLTRTPRAAKKLVNLYRLARIGVDPGDLAAFVGTEAIPGEHQAVQILLALLVGSPDQAATVFRRILETSPTSKITEALRGLPADIPAGAQAADLIERLITGQPVIMDTAVYQQWCPKLARFSFYTRNLAG
ncbi:P-loop NTPase fold protein [Streptomyces sp. NPDC006173]|uniref:P-loop NTPase fold protein n=1 Tax=Streptomyces sp. NPDC006173 TaxID=3155349 RepID=UPI0034082E50